MVCMICSYHQTSIVLYAVGITLFVTICITLVSVQSIFDFTNCWFLLLCVLFALIGLGIASLISFVFVRVDPYSGVQTYNSIYGGFKIFIIIQTNNEISIFFRIKGLCALVLAIFLGIDTQLVIGNKKYIFNPENYASAALQLYLDILLIFLYILKATGKRKWSDINKKRILLENV